MRKGEKRLLTLRGLMVLMNEPAFANAGINPYGMVNTDREGRKYDGEAIAVDDAHYGIFLGNAFNPLIFRGENKVYPDFTPGLRRIGGMAKEKIARRDYGLMVYKNSYLSMRLSRRPVMRKQENKSGGLRIEI